MSLQLEEYIPGTIWICRYPVRYQPLNLMLG
jgi:hypothetical protein